MAQILPSDVRTARGRISDLLPTRSVVERTIWSVTVLLDIDDTLASLAGHLEDAVEAEALLLENSGSVALNENIRILN